MGYRYCRPLSCRFCRPSGYMYCGLLSYRYYRPSGYRYCSPMSTCIVGSQNKGIVGPQNMGIVGPWTMGNVTPAMISDSLVIRLTNLFSAKAEMLECNKANLGASRCDCARTVSHHSLRLPGMGTHEGIANWQRCQQLSGSCRYYANRRSRPLSWDFHRGIGNILSQECRSNSCVILHIR